MLFPFPFTWIVEFEPFTISVDFDFISIFLLIHWHRTEQVAVCLCTAIIYVGCSVVVQNFLILFYYMFHLEYVFSFDSPEKKEKIWLIASLHVIDARKHVQNGPNTWIAFNRF